MNVKLIFSPFFFQAIIPILFLTLLSFVQGVSQNSIFFNLSNIFFHFFISIFKKLHTNNMNVIMYNLFNMKDKNVYVVCGVHNMERGLWRLHCEC